MNPPLSPHIFAWGCSSLNPQTSFAPNKEETPHGMGSIPQWEAATILKLHFEKCAEFSLTC